MTDSDNAPPTRAKNCSAFVQSLTAPTRPSVVGLLDAVGFDVAWPRDRVADVRWLGGDPSIQG
jgi:hypothetical protein